MRHQTCFLLSAGTVVVALGTSGCTGPARRPDSGRYADQARLQQLIRDYQKPNGSVDPWMLVDPEFYWGLRRARAPVFDLPATPPGGR